MTPDDEVDLDAVVMTRTVMTTTVTRVPNVEKTPRRTVRVPDERWDAVKAKAEERCETVTDVINRKLDEYLAEPDPEPED